MLAHRAEVAEQRGEQHVGRQLLAAVVASFVAVQLGARGVPPRLAARRQEHREQPFSVPRQRRSLLRAPGKGGRCARRLRLLFARLLEEPQVGRLDHDDARAALEHDVQAVLGVVVTRRLAAPTVELRQPNDAHGPPKHQFWVLRQHRRGRWGDCHHRAAQQLRSGRVAHHLGVLQCHHIVLVPGLWVCSCAQERPHNVHVAVLRREHKRRAAHAVMQVDRGAARQQELHDIHVAHEYVLVRDSYR
eukprot:scaffold96550_cov39-Phaeocystis_antarctica.AAC.2